MIVYTTYIDLIKNVRSEILTQSELVNERVINAVSVRGPALSKLINNNTSTSINLHDVLIIFELLVDTDSDQNIVLTNEDDSKDIITQFRLLLKVYGNASQEMANILLARFKSEEIITRLYAKNVWVKNVSFAQTMNEIINNTVWPRCDLEMTLIARFHIEQLNEIPYADSIKNIIISRGEKTNEEE